MVKHFFVILLPVIQAGAQVTEETRKIEKQGIRIYMPEQFQNGYHRSNSEIDTVLLYVPYNFKYDRSISIEQQVRLRSRTEDEEIYRKQKQRIEDIKRKK